MKIHDLMTRNPEVVEPSASLYEAAQKMKEFNIGSLPVCNGKRVLGIITDRDLTTRATAEGLDPGITQVQEIMTKDLLYCYDDQDIQDAADIMSRYQVRRLPIVDREKNLVGVISLGDISVNAGNDRLSGDILEDISQPSKPDR